MNRLPRLASVVAVQRIQLVAQAQDVLGVNLKIRRLTFNHSADQRLVHEILSVRQREATTLGTAASDHTAHAGSLTNDVRRHWARHKSHGVNNAKSSTHAATRAVDIHADLRLRVLVGKEQKLRDHQVGHRVRDATA